VGSLVIEEGLPRIYLRFDPFFHGERKIVQVQSGHAHAALDYGGDNVRTGSWSTLIHCNPIRVCFYWTALQEFPNTCKSCLICTNTLRISWLQLPLMICSVILHYIRGTVIAEDFTQQHRLEVKCLDVVTISLHSRDWAFLLKKRIMWQRHAMIRFWLTAEYISLVIFKIKRIFRRNRDCFSSDPNSSKHNHSSNPHYTTSVK
jgi:hypothetical protein